jgi:hypothetical protein
MTRAQVVQAMACETEASQALDAALPLIFRSIQEHGLLGAMMILSGEYDPRQDVAQAAARALGAGEAGL